VIGSGGDHSLTAPRTDPCQPFVAGLTVDGAKFFLVRESPLTYHEDIVPFIVALSTVPV